jgi:hypothetical protein
MRLKISCDDLQTREDPERPGRSTLVARLDRQTDTISFCKASEDLTNLTN